MMRRTTLALLLAAGAASLTGCAGYYYGENYGPTLGSIVRGVWPFLVAHFVVLALLVLFPALVTVPAKWLGG